MQQSFNKLVRDKLPAIIEANGETPTTRILSDTEYGDHLLAKLREECDEATQDGADIVEEFADMLEVMLAICAHRGIPMANIESVRKAKLEHRGGFEGRVFLIETNASDTSAR